MLGCEGQQVALCYINPLFLKEPPSRGALHKRHRFKRSLRVRVSTETSMTLSSPPRSAELDCAEPSLPLQKRASTAAGLLRRTQALSPTSEEEEDLIPQDPQQVRTPPLSYTCPLPFAVWPRIRPPSCWFYKPPSRWVPIEGSMRSK